MDHLTKFFLTCGVESIHTNFLFFADNRILEVIQRVIYLPNLTKVSIDLLIIINQKNWQLCTISFLIHVGYLILWVLTLSLANLITHF